MAERKRSKKKINRATISDPRDFVHLQHVGFDQEDGLAAQNVDAQLQALLDTIGMKGVGGKKEKRAKEFIRAVMKNESMEERREVHDEPDPHKTTTEDDKNEDETVDSCNAPCPVVDTISDAPSSESGDSSSTDTGEAELSSDEQRRVSLIWSLLTRESPAQVLSDDSAKRLGELESCLAKKEDDLNSLRDESSALSRQLKNLEMENMTMRSQCGTLKQENAALTRQYTNVKTTKEKEAGFVTDSFSIQPQDILMFGKTLGTGCHATVRVGRWCGAPIAVKVFGRILVSEQNMSSCQQELSTCCKLSHPNLVSVFGYTAVKALPLQLAMELLEGSLSEVIDAAISSRSYLTRREQLDMAIDCAAGLTFLHSRTPKPYSHGSLCEASILVTSQLTAKIGDLGASQVVSRCSGERAFKSQYMAPENAGGVYVNTVAADVYSMGCTFAYLFMGEELNEEMIEEQLESITDPELNLVCVQMTSPSPVDRLTAVQGLSLLQQKTRDDEYRRCPGKRMASGKLEGFKLVLTKV